MAVKASFTISGTITVQYADSTTLSAASELLPDQLAADAKTKIQTISGVSAAEIRCHLLDLVGVS